MQGRPLPLGLGQLVAAHTNAKIIIIGQAPGTKVHLRGYHGTTQWQAA